MEKKTYYCDRCGAEVQYPLSTSYNIIKRKLFILDKRFGDTLDLCQDCYDSLEQWMKRKQQ